MFKNLALRIASSQIEENNPKKIKREIIKKEKAIAYLTGFDDNTLGVDDTVDRFWIEHNPFVTIYSYFDNYKHFINTCDNDGELMVCIYCSNFELEHVVNSTKHQDSWLICATGTLMDHIQNDYNSKLKLIINDYYELDLDLMDFANQEYKTEKLPNVIEIPHDYLCKMIVL